MDSKRQIKFRVYDGLKMTYEDNYEDEHNPTWVLHQKLYKPYGDFEIMQFTGLKDKKGKEIYEGDIVNDKPGKMKMITMQVKWNNTFSRFDLWWLDGSNCYAGLINSPTCYEVVGNIYENPELLK